MPASVEDIAVKANRDTAGVRYHLETMADKGLVYTFDKNDVRFYSLLPLLPGIFEMQFLSGDVSERAVKLAYLFEDYFKALDRYTSSNTQTPIPFPVARVISVEKEIQSSYEIHPYDKVSEYIDKAEYIAVGTCYCRHHGELLGRPCTKPKDVCMGFGPDARYMAERKFGRLVGKDEARAILRRTEEAGLVHCSSNMTKYVQFVCNCCPCHCGILQSMKKFNMKGSAAVSGFITMFDADSCIACGDCVERCPMEALTMKDDSLSFDESKCIGCGLCSSACTTGSLKLVARNDAPVPPRDWRQLNASLLSSVSELLKG
jgi:ferredoxin